MFDALAALAKAVLYGGLLSGAGAALADASSPRLPDAASPRLIARGAATAIVAALAGALILVFRLGGQFDAATLSAVFLSGSGAAIGLQIAGCLLLLSVTGNDDAARLSRVPNAGLALLSLAIYGHSAAAGGQQAALALIHVVVGAWWIGALWRLRQMCLHSPAEVAADFLARFSKLAFFLIAVLVVAGTVLLSMLTDFSRAPWLSPYGQIFALKLGLVVGVLGLAAYNRFRLTPRILAGDGAASITLRRTIDVELLIIGAVLLTTAILVTYTSPPE